LANKYSRWFNNDIAESITISGQLATKWVEVEVNGYLNKILKTTDFDYIIGCDTDSVVGDTTINVNGIDTTISEYFEDMKDYIKCDKFNENYIKEGDKSLTPSINKISGNIEYKPIKYVMKHKVKKEMYRITNNRGESVTVTEDHSVIVKDKKSGKILEISPKKINIENHRIINIIGTDTDS